MARITVIRGSRKQLMSYLREHSEAELLTLLAEETDANAHRASRPTMERTGAARQRNGVPLFPELPQATPVTVELVKRLLDEENALPY